MFMTPPTETPRKSGVEVDLFYVKDVKKLSAKDYHFLVLGFPTKFGGRLPLETSS